MMDYFEVDTEQLQKDLTLLDEKADELKTVIEKLTGGVDELCGYWEGPAKEQFMARMRQDEAYFMSIVADVKAVKEDMLFARNEYDRSEDDVRGMVAAVKI